MAAEVVVYRTPYCPHCFRAKALLERKGVAYREVDVSGDAKLRQWLRDTTGLRTVPQIFINQRPVGGADELYALERRGELDRLLAENAESAGIE
jgi:glutaredoxin 3